MTRARNKNDAIVILIPIPVIIKFVKKIKVVNNENNNVR